MAKIDGVIACVRSALTYAGQSGRRVVSAFVATAFTQDNAERRVAARR